MTIEKLNTTVTEMVDEKCIDKSFIWDEDDRPKVAYNEFSYDIPVISLSGIDTDDQRDNIRRKITDACETWGIFQIVDYGVDPNIISEMARLSTEFFNLPAYEKRKFEAVDGKPGSFFISSPFKEELVHNWRETVTQCTYPIKNDYTLWPDKPEGWKTITKEYSESMMGLTHKLLGVLSESMGLETEALTKACLEMDQRVMINYYPKCSQPDLTLGLPVTPTREPLLFSMRTWLADCKLLVMMARLGSLFRLLLALLLSTLVITLIDARINSSEDNSRKSRIIRAKAYAHFRTKSKT